MKDLVAIEQLPEIPPDWNYEESVAKVLQLVYKWKNLTIELATELYIARKALSKEGRPWPKITGAFAPVKTWTNYCQEIGVDKSTVNRWLKRFLLATTTQNLPPPKGQSQVLYADPPWNYSNTGFDQSAQQHYPTIPTIKLCSPEEWLKLPIAEILEPRSVLFLWVTYPFAREGFQICEAWGFQYKAQMVWVKDRSPGMGWFVKSRHELLYIATRGQELHPSIQPDSVLVSPVTSHSEKPKEVRHLIEQMYTGPYIELFAREKLPNNEFPKWRSWGNEL